MIAKRSILNVSIGLLSQLVTIALSFFIPRLIMLNYGSEANGLVASITQIIAYLSLLEAGVGAASIQALYRPIGQNDRSKINDILAATSIYYKKTGLYYFAAVILIALVYPFVIESGFDALTVMAVVALSGLGGAVNYYFQGKFRVLLIAEGKSYIESSVVMIANIVNSLVRILLLLQGFDIIAVQAVYFIVMLLQIVVYRLYIRKYYKWIDLNRKPDYAAISQKNSALVHELSYLIFRNTDILVLTVFTNLKVVSIYVLYNMVFNFVDNLVQMLSGSLKFALGQSYFDNRAKFMKMYNMYETYYIGFIFAIISMVTILILPFMGLYTAGIKDMNYIDYLLPLLFAAAKLLINARTPADAVIEIAGHFRSTQGRSILESVINLVCSIGFVLLFGIYGVLMGTIVALLYRSLDMIIYSNRRLLERSPWITLRKWGANIALFIFTLLVVESVKLPIHSFFSLIVWGLVLSALIFPLYFTVNALFEKGGFAVLPGLARKVTSRFRLGKKPAAQGGSQ
ncbi:O-antigen/teichoic acid export membrane protein [Paenibacillus forsythiae]|uniref:O-antigen/teichoic acid export membrane protein n=1 Tax=Paenibacillus forsythiae TaxID=365616 RepID=A0ABU3H848_9BACL|nr:sugar isomerase [Paenibacillus forsythiae]MDT3427002.1 O-antigen/teichoic acid export membrane protein [Paenibacillus forsythiae]